MNNNKCSFEVRATTMEGRIQCDYCVVGAGMIGSAAAKHLQVLNPSSKVVLVGPTEPKVNPQKNYFGDFSTISGPWEI